MGRISYYTSKITHHWDKEIKKLKEPVTIALDAMGGDYGPINNLEGSIMAVSEQENLKVILVGQEDEIKKAIGNEFIPPEVSILHASEVIGMGDSATRSVRSSDNSISKGLNLLKSGEASGFVSMGNTGAVAAASLINLGRIKGISRPAIMSLLPTETRIPAIVLDVGANVDCKPEHLLQFAKMANIYSQKVLNTPNPKVALLSIGEEPTKGNSMVKKAHTLLAESDMNFIGNIESSEVLAGKANIVVCDGFVGNILLKFAESMFKTLKRSFKRDRFLIPRIIFGGFMLIPTLKGMISDYDYREYGGAPLIGVNGNVIIGHGRSNPTAIKNAIILAQKMAIGKVYQEIHEQLHMESLDE